MPSSKNISSLVINKVPSSEIFNSIKSQGLVNEDELYLVEDDSGLPAVTLADSGKFLRVVDGKWKAVGLTDVSIEGA